jgi:hypothetical protein
VLRSDKHHHVVQASNCITRLWSTQFPKTRTIKKAREKPMNERQKFYHRKAEKLANMTDEQIAQVEDHDAQNIFLGRLAIYLNEEHNELLNAVLNAADLDETGKPMNTRGRDKCHTVIDNFYKEWREKNPELANPRPASAKKNNIPTLSPNGPGGGPPRMLHDPAPPPNPPPDPPPPPKRDMPHEFNTFGFLLAFLIGLFAWGFGMTTSAAATEPIALTAAALVEAPVLNPEGVTVHRPGCEPRTRPAASAARPRLVAESEQPTHAAEGRSARPQSRAGPA